MVIDGLRWRELTAAAQRRRAVLSEDQDLSAQILCQVQGYAGGHRDVPTVDQQISDTKGQSAAQLPRNIGAEVTRAGECLLHRPSRVAIAVEEITGCTCAGRCFSAGRVKLVREIEVDLDEMPGHVANAPAHARGRSPPLAASELRQEVINGLGGPGEVCLVGESHQLVPYGLCDSDNKKHREIVRI